MAQAVAAKEFVIRTQGLNCAISVLKVPKI